MGNDNFVVRRRSTWLSVLKAVLIIAAVAFVAYKIYDKFFRKKVQQEILGATESDELLGGDSELTTEAIPSEEMFEADAADVIDIAE